MNVKGKEIKTDEAGFLIDPADWNIDVVRAIASIEGIVELNK
jgi:sulfur relay (sulfurtransferase) DsrC/TusE family protein